MFSGGSIGELAISEEGGSVLTFSELLKSGGYAVVVKQEMRTPGAPFTYFLYLSDTTWTTLSTDTPANMSMIGTIQGVEISRTLPAGSSSLNTGNQSGTVSVVTMADGVPVYSPGYGVTYEAMTSVRQTKVCEGWPIEILIGRPADGLDSFVRVFRGNGAGIRIADAATGAGDEN